MQQDHDTCCCDGNAECKVIFPLPGSHFSVHAYLFDVVKIGKAKNVADNRAVNRAKKSVNDRIVSVNGFSRARRDAIYRVSLCIQCDNGDAINRVSTWFLRTRPDSLSLRLTNYYMTFRRFLVFYRLPLAVVLIVLGFWLGFSVTWWVAWIPFLVALIFVFAHFFIGPMSLIQGYIEAGDMEGAQKMLDRVKYPNLLYKPIRSSYYMLRANLSTMNNDLDKAEADLRKGLATGMPEKEYEGTAYLQLGTIAMQKGNMKEAYEQLRKAIKIGLSDKNNAAAAYLYLSNISVQRRDFRGAKMYFSKAKSSKPTEKQIVSQLVEMEKYMARLPG